MQLNWTPKARKARQTAIQRLFRVNFSAARKQILEIGRQIAQLRQHPDLGRLGRVPGTRELVISHTPYIVVYRVHRRAGRIDILNFLHSAQKWPP